DIRLRKNRLPDHGRRALKLRSLEDAQPAAAVALDSDEAFTLAGLQQVHQAAEPVATLVESTLGLSKNLFHVAEIHRPPCVPGGDQDAPGDAHAFGVVADLRWHVHRCRPDLVRWPRRVAVNGTRPGTVRR